MIGGYNQVLVTIRAELEVAATPPQLQLTSEHAQGQIFNNSGKS